MIISSRTGKPRFQVSDAEAVKRFIEFTMAIRKAFSAEEPDVVESFEDLDELLAKCLKAIEDRVRRKSVVEAE
jgi:hypothetical protein